MNRPASGHQFELTRGGARAQVGQVAAVLRAFSVDGVDYCETWADDELPPMGCGIVLVPWPNRVQDGRWTYQDAVQQLDLTETSRGHASHGLLRNTAYEAVEVSADRVVLAAPIYPQHGYPFTLETSVAYQLTDEGLTVTHTLTNLGVDPAPFGVGTHPYLRVGTNPIEALVLTVSGRTRAAVDDRLIPTGLESVEGTSVDLRGGVRLGEVHADVALTDLEVADGRVEHRLAAPSGDAVVLWADEVFGWVQIFTPPNFPDPAGERLAVAIEPMTCGVNAFNNGYGLLTLQPGETWSASWGIRPEPAGS